ncbi:transcription factor RLM1 [Teleopsis dalmanni]|uniref:transcription factor RLM1 n=1 Tax=Teleopsis dalmanni TaxID=139649 RepID=UPI0018CEF4C6|nr:transcription factor RLM1 [Teleopsis dalmanni]
MMETFIVLGLCFILYEALDFFQGCMHSSAPSASDQIDAYRRQLDEQRQQQQQEQFLANLTPLLGAQLATLTPSTTPTASTASVISDLRAQQHQQEKQNIESHSVSTSALNGGFRPAHRSVYESQELHATSSLPRDYYHLQQQQLKNKNSAKSLLSKFSSSSDNRIFPESSSVLGVPAGVITTQPGLVGNTFDCQQPVVAPSPLVLDLKRAILSNNNNNNNNYNNELEQSAVVKTINATQQKLIKQQPQHSSNGSFSTEESDSDDSTTSSGSASAGSASLASCGSDQETADEREFAVGSCSSSHADFREIECERLRRKCVSVKRIYSISEKF